jgi:hypothetical protein
MENVWGTCCEFRLGCYFSDTLLKVSKVAVDVESVWDIGRSVHPGHLIYFLRSIFKASFRNILFFCAGDRKSRLSIR